MSEAGRITALIDGDISGLSSALNQAKSQATSAVSGIEGDFKKGFGSGLQSSISGVTSSMGPLGSAISGVSGGLGLAATAGLAGVAALGALGAQAVSTAANWESLMASVSKTTGVEDSGLDQLSSDLQEIRMDTGATAEEIANAVTTAGSVGIPKEELAGFTEVALQMGSAFSMSSDAAVNGISAIGNSAKDSGTSWTDFATQAGSSVNVLADSMRTSEEQILTGMTHLGATMGLLKPPEDTVPAWMALVATVQSLGLAGDQAGEAVQDALTYAAKNAESKDLGIDVAGLLGISNEQLQLDLRTNAPEVLQDVAVAIADLPLEDQAAAMAMFGSTGSKAIALLMGDLDKSTGKFDKLGTAIDDSNKAWAEGTSLSTAYAASQETFNAATDRLGASLDVAGQKLGTVFLPALTWGVDVLADGVDLLIGFGEAASNLFSSDFSGLWGSNKEDMYQEIVDKKRAEEAGEEVGDAIGDGIEESDDLAEAPGDALSSSTAKDAVGDAAKESAEEFSKEWLEEFETQQADREIAKILARSGNEALTKNKGNVAGSVTTELENGLEVQVAYQGSNKSIASRLFIDGQQIGDSVYGANRDDSVRKLLEGSGLGYNEGNVLDLTGKSGEAAIWRLNQSTQIEVDYDAIVSNFGQQFATRMENEGSVLGQVGSETAISAFTSLLENMRSPMLDSLGAVYDDIATLAAERPLAASEYELFGQEFKDKIASQVVDAEQFVEEQLEGFGETASSALSGGIIDSTEAGNLLGLKPQLEYLQEYFPEQFAAMGGEAALELIAALEAGDYEGAARIINEKLVIKPTVDLSIFGSEMADIKGSINLADILADPEEFKEKIMDVPDFVENTFQPALSDEIDFMVGQWDSGYTEAREQTEDFVDDLVVASEKMPSLFSTSQLASLEKYKNGLIDAKQALEGLGYEAKEVADAIDRINFAQNAAEGSYEDVMFYHSYIGPTSGYASWLAEESGRSEEEVRNVLIKLNTTEAEEELKKLDEKAEAEKSKLVKINDTLAMRSIAAIDIAAAKSITKTVFIEYDDPGYSYDDYTSISAASASSSSKKVSTTTGKITKYYPWMSFANEGYVASPTLAVVGDRPGGEYVVGAARFEAAAAKAGGQTITIAPVYHINGAGLSEDEIASLLEKNNKALLREVADQIKTGKSF